MVWQSLHLNLATATAGEHVRAQFRSSSRRWCRRILSRSTLSLPATKILLRGSVLASALLLAGQGALQAGAPSAKLDFKLPKTTTLGEPAIMAVQLHNTTGYRIMVDFGVEEQTRFVFRHTRPDGTLVKAEPSLVPAARGRTSRLMLRGNSTTVLVVLDEWLTLSDLGLHKIDVEFTGAVAIEGGNAADVKRSAQLTIEVKPRDARRLDKRGSDWLKQVSKLAPGIETRAASTALLVMKDPVVIPYLELATVRTRSFRYAEALAAMPAPEARTALERLSRHQDPDVRGLAARALSRAR